VSGDTWANTLLNPDTDYPYNVACQAAQLNTTGRFVSICNGNFTVAGTKIKVTSCDVTWNTSTTPPTINYTEPFILEPNANGRINIVAGTADNESYFLFQDNADSNKLKYKKVSASSQNTLSVSPYYTMTDITPGSNFNLMDATRMVKVGSTTYWATVMNNSANNQLSVLVAKLDESTAVDYKIFPAGQTVTEGNSINFTVNTANVANGTVLYYDIAAYAGTVDASDFSGGSLTGSVTINSNTGSIGLVPTAGSTEGVEKFVVNLRTGSTSGPIVATSQPVEIREAVSSFTFVSSASSNSNNITIPATAQVGDVAVLFDMQLNTGSVIPTGFTQISTNSTTNFRINTSYKLLVAGDPGATISGMNNTPRKVMAVFRPNSPIQTVSPVVLGNQNTTATPANQTLSGGTAPTIYFAMYAKSASTTPTRGWSVGTPTEISRVSTSGVYMKYLIYNTTPASTTISMTDAGTNGLVSFRLGFS
jgi:hypothetical protein